MCGLETWWWDCGSSIQGPKGMMLSTVQQNGMLSSLSNLLCLWHLDLLTALSFLSAKWWKTKNEGRTPSILSALSFLNCISYTFFINRFLSKTLCSLNCAFLLLWKRLLLFLLPSPHVPQLSHKIEVINCSFRQVNYLVTLIFKTISMSGSE